MVKCLCLPENFESGSSLTTSKMTQDNVSSSGDVCLPRGPSVITNDCASSGQCFLPRSLLCTLNTPASFGLVVHGRSSQKFSVSLCLRRAVFKPQSFWVFRLQPDYPVFNLNLNHTSAYTQWGYWCFWVKSALFISCLLPSALYFFSFLFFFWIFSHSLLINSLVLHCYKMP